MALLLGVRFPEGGSSAPILVAEKVFQKEYGRYGEETKSFSIHIRHFEYVHAPEVVTDIVDRVDTILRDSKLKIIRTVADCSCIGSVAIEELRKRRIAVAPVFFEALQPGCQGEYLIPLQEAIPSTQVLLKEHRIKFAPGIASLGEITGELERAYRKEQEYGDAALLLCAVVWYSSRYVHEPMRRERLKNLPKAGRL